MSKTKVLPKPPASLDRLEEVRSAVPLVPGSVDDCCTRLQGRAGVPSRDGAREWLTFLDALGLATEGDRGFSRTREDPDEATLAERFRERVFLVEDVLDALEEDLQEADAVFEAVRDEVPQWERSRHTDWEGEWRERVYRILEWAALFGLAEREDLQYRR